MQLIAEKIGLQLTIANNGKKAVDAALTHRYDLILMDMQMPVMGGLEAATLLREKDCNTPIIALTGNVFQSDIANYEAAGCNGYIKKPFTLHDLTSALQQFIVIDTKTNSEIINDGELRCYALENKQTTDEENGLVEQVYNFSIPEGPILSIFNDDIPGISKIIGAYVGRLANNQDEIRNILSGKDWHRLQKIIHNIKGTAQTFGFPLLSDIAKVAHTRLAEKCHDEIPALVNNLCVVIERIVEGNKLERSQELSDQTKEIT